MIVDRRHGTTKAHVLSYCLAAGASLLVSCGLFVGREVETRERGRRVFLVLDSYRIGPMTSLSHHICEQVARHYQGTRFELLLSCWGIVVGELWPVCRA